MQGVHDCHNSVNFVKTNHHHVDTVMMHHNGNVAGADSNENPSNFTMKQQKSM